MSEIDNVTKENMPDENYWRGFNELYNEPGFAEQSGPEFQDKVTDEFNPEHLSGLSRRKFLALIGASAALAGAGCSNYRDKGDIVPYNKKPEETIPGEPNFYASTCTECSLACGLLIRTREGRPIKVDGNPDHPVSKGKICSRGQASILNLYDPERLQNPLKRFGDVFNKITWKNADTEIINALNNTGSKGIAVVTNRIVSPSSLNVINAFISRYPTAMHYSYELVNDSIRQSAWAKSGNKGLFPLISWDKAKIILTLESDVLNAEGELIETLQQFAKNRDIDKPDSFSRLYAVEANLSVTGMNADYRIKLRPDAISDFLVLLNNGLNGNTSAVKNFADKFNIKEKTIKYLISDLLKYKGQSIIYAGDKLPEQIHISVNKLNDLLGNDALYRKDTEKVYLHNLSTSVELNRLINNMKSGKIGAVIHLDSNPAFHFSASMGYSEALKKVPFVVTLTESENETSELSNYVLPLNHQFESWGDAQVRSNVLSLQQPVIQPIFATRQKEAVLLTWLSGRPENYNETTYYNYLMKCWEQTYYKNSGSEADFTSYWNNSLHDGVAISPKKLSQSMEVSVMPDKSLPNYDGNYILILKENVLLGDGRFANNGWLLELPHPVTKIVWDNYASISAGAAKELGVKNNDFINISVNRRQLKIPVFIQPGCTDKTITIELGWGRKKVGVVGTSAGFNANDFINYDDVFSPWIIQNVSVQKAGGSYSLATTQEHHSFDKEREQDLHLKRNIIREATVDAFRKNPNIFGEANGKGHKTFYTETDQLFSKGVKWGMAIDLNKCTGCGACIVACTSENNVPVVGKEQVERGREMHWIRVDRYYSGPVEEPKVSTQVMLCQHCDHAPCENVCPVVATTHSPDGLNQMVYNRCVGTRYCSNNCPYKVRRFNFYNFRDKFKSGYQQENLFTLLYNPEVTVRSRGVMEKCTFCIQRITKAKQDATAEKTEFKGSSVRTACQDSCITEAISFGDQHDKDSVIREKMEHKLAYYVLEELNIRPNVAYMAKLRNTRSEEA
ncbi:MAG: TAT-variant-translocated molybdopterin oxidoreductase [Bacteroidota bacterium]|nr:TAT-variant-translocated molybdopterin oxidoreductase [Bacteroidota bacterium]